MNLQTCTRQQLVAALLDPRPSEAPVTTPTIGVRDAGIVGQDDPPVLQHRLAVARELLLRNLRDRMTQTPAMNSPELMRDWLRLLCGGLEHDVFLVIYLDAHQQLIGEEDAFRGTLTQTAVYPRELVKGALARSAAAVVVAHNHPSGQPEPSRADEHLTQTVKAALNLVEVRLLDHFIVAGDQILSFAEKGLL